ncbi:MAG: hypothetical protein WCO71_00380 [Pseudomonadota bacterium]
MHSSHLFANVLLVFTVVTSCAPVRQGGRLKDVNAAGFPNAPIVNPRDRFDVLIRDMESYLQRTYTLPDVDSKFNAMRGSGITQSLRYYQELTYLYEKKYPDLKVYGDEAKILENHVSHYGDLEMFLSTAQGSGNQDAITKAQQNLDQGREAFKAYVGSSKWFRGGADGMIAELRAKLSATAWLPIDGDRNLVLTRLARKMKKQHDKKYDLTKVEEGIHELRRDARRLSYLNQASSGIVRSDKPGNCPLLSTAAFDALPDADKTKPVPNVVKAPVVGPTTDYYCHVESCLTSKLESSSSSLVSVKSSAAGYLARGQAVPQALLDQAKQIYDSLIKSEAYMFLWSELKSCRTAGGANDGDCGDDDDNLVAPNPVPANPPPVNPAPANPAQPGPANANPGAQP